MSTAKKNFNQKICNGMINLDNQVKIINFLKIIIIILATQEAKSIIAEKRFGSHDKFG